MTRYLALKEEVDEQVEKGLDAFLSPNLFNDFVQLTAQAGRISTNTLNTSWKNRSSLTPT